MISRYRALAARWPQVAASSVATCWAPTASDWNLLTSCWPNSLSRNWAVAAASGSSAAAPVNSSVAGSAVAKKTASTGIRAWMDRTTSA